MLVEAATFLLAASLHRGVQIPLGFVTLTEPMIGPASIVETTCELALAIAAITVLGGSRWGWLTAVGAHVARRAVGPSSPVVDVAAAIVAMLVPFGTHGLPDHRRPADATLQRLV